MSHPLAVCLKRGCRIMRARRERASHRHEKQDECYVETCEVLMILPYPLARSRISGASFTMSYMYNIEINGIQR